ncbi:MAG TPA: hypothetical protein VFC82_09090 [Actinomycetaceae bacterium]|nr:hypothetical protein [Actinomycetaceae bacterium]
MSGIDPASPAAYSWWVPALGAVLVLLVIAWLVFVLRRPRAVPEGKKRDREAGELRAEYGRRLEDYYVQYTAGTLTLRDFHLEVAGLVRGFGTERMGRDLAWMSRGEVVEYFPGSDLGELLARCEQPSFSHDPDAEAAQTFGMAQGVITEW